MAPKPKDAGVSAPQQDTTEPAYKAPPVVVAYHAIMRALCEQGMAKSNRNQQQGFNFRGIDQVYAVLTPELVRHDCILTPSVMSIDNWTGLTSKGSTMFYTRVKVKFTLTSLLDGSMLSWEYIGEGADQGDKSTSKALSMAYKYMAIHSFGIPVTPQSTDDADAETVEETHAPAPKPPTTLPPSIDLDALVDLVSSSKTLEDLQLNHASAIRAARNRNKPDWEAAVNEVKDRRKAALTAE